MQVSYTLAVSFLVRTCIFHWYNTYKSVKKNKSGNPSNIVEYIVGHVAYVANPTGVITDLPVTQTCHGYDIALWTFLISTWINVRIELHSLEKEIDDIA